jgi:hypothetical protein
MHLGCFTIEEDDARAHDRMRVCCDLHAVESQGANVTGLNFAYTDYVDELGALGDITQEKLMEKLRWEAKLARCVAVAAACSAAGGGGAGTSSGAAARAARGAAAVTAAAAAAGAGAGAGPGLQALTAKAPPAKRPNTGNGRTGQTIPATSSTNFLTLIFRIQRHTMTPHPMFHLARHVISPLILRPILREFNFRWHGRRHCACCRAHFNSSRCPS